MEKSICFITCATVFIVCLFAINISAKGGGSNFTVTTTYTSADITQTSATAGGTVSSGGGTVNARGVCFSTSTNPTTSNNRVTSGSGTGSFTCSLTGLTANTTYYIRAYATTRTGTTYGTQITFTTLEYPVYGGEVTDYDGNNYPSVVIGTQEWMLTNLKTTHYQNGEDVQLVSDNTVWLNLTTGGYCSYGNNDNYVSTYGLLYNWFAASDSRNLAPTGWHVATKADWGVLESYLGGFSNGSTSYIGKKLKESGSVHWCSTNTGNNVSGFAAFPGGQRLASGGFAYLYSECRFWSSSLDGGQGWFRTLECGTDYIGTPITSTTSSNRGYSVRCVKNSSSSSPRIGYESGIYQEGAGFTLMQNFPNPFNSTTNINYSISETSLVHLSVFNVYGSLVAELENGMKPAGAYNVIFDGNKLSNGTYFYRLEVNTRVLTGSMKIIK